MRRVLVRLGLVWLCATGACSLFADLDGLHGHPPPPDDAGGEATADAAPVPDAAPETDGAGEASADPRCRGTKGPEQVRVGDSCVDATEVKGKQYAEFLAAKAGDTTGQPTSCAWNTSFDSPFGLKDDHPVHGIDWCDAVAYCAWAGKRLCGRIGGGAVPAEVRNNALADEWYRACSADGAMTFPYGETYVPGACNLPEADAGGPVAVASMPGCEGGYPGIFDMSGNLWEWENSCASDEPDAPCALRGGSYASNSPGRCDSVITFLRDAVRDATIRCCSDLAD